MAQGAFSLITHAIKGSLKTVNKIISTVMKLLANLTLDKKYL